MLFSSIPFLYYYLPVVLIVYYVISQRLKNGVLLFASLFFYAWGEPRYLLLMLVSITCGYAFGRLLEIYREHRYGKWFLMLSVLVNAGLLVYFKYADFFIENMNRVTGLSIPVLRLALPIGISFYTFQLISYLVDVYRGEAAAQKSVVELALYVAMFPQLIAGPIVRYNLIERQLNRRTHNIEKFSLGIRRFVLGLAKKILIANSLGELCDIFKSSNEKSILFFWLYAIAFTLYIYFDFSGYSDMAIGLGRMFGFHFSENFNYPYVSKTITEFWRRWHISLGLWFRDYVYIPLGGNRKSKVKWIVNMFVVWMLTGLWHGAEWNFIIWGLFFCLVLLVEKVWLWKYLEKGSFINHIYVMFLVVISFVIFDADNMKGACIYIGGLFGIGSYPMVSTEFVYYLQSYAIVLVLAIIGVTPVSQNVLKMITSKPLGKRLVNGFELIVLVILMLVITAYLVDNSFNPFLYFRF